MVSVQLALHSTAHFSILNSKWEGYTQGSLGPPLQQNAKEVETGYHNGGEGSGEAMVFGSWNQGC